eukprot:7379089-Prymnesium_polylepis.2
MDNAAIKLNRNFHPHSWAHNQKTTLFMCEHAPPGAHPPSCEPNLQPTATRPANLCALVGLAVVVPLAAGRDDARAGVTKAKETDVVACGESESDASHSRRGHHALATHDV